MNLRVRITFRGSIHVKPPRNTCIDPRNQTLKHIMFRILTERQRHTWVGILYDVIENKLTTTRRIQS
jgi:hypothetical protein